ncbi:MAG: hypothetical protein LIP06_11945 [Tannerellaceae bacterium]|nr:hypothetical protein [Tannerellaceae bacterium]
MKQHSKQSPPVSHTIQSKTGSGHQAPAGKILQRYEDQLIQRQSIEEDELLQGRFKVAQREEIEDEEMLQGKFKDTTQRMETEENR